MRVDTDTTISSPKLLVEARRKRYSIRTEQAHVAWAKCYILFHGEQRTIEIGKAPIIAFLNHLAVKQNVAASTQNHTNGSNSLNSRRRYARKERMMTGETEKDIKRLNAPGVVVEVDENTAEELRAFAENALNAREAL